MATKITYVCDQCGADLDDKPTATIVGWEGQVYELELCEPCDESTTKTMLSIVEVGTRTSRMPSRPAPAIKAKTKPKPRTRRGRHSPAPTAAELRAWATNQGYEIAGRGRVPDSIKTAYQGSLQ